MCSKKKKSDISGRSFNYTFFNVTSQVKYAILTPSIYLREMLTYVGPKTHTKICILAFLILIKHWKTLNSLATEKWGRFLEIRNQGLKLIKLASPPQVTSWEARDKRPMRLGNSGTHQHDSEPGVSPAHSWVWTQKQKQTDKNFSGVKKPDRDYIAWESWG